VGVFVIITLERSWRKAESFPPKDEPEGGYAGRRWMIRVREAESLSLGQIEKSLLAIEEIRFGAGGPRRAAAITLPVALADIELLARVDEAHEPARPGNRLHAATWTGSLVVVITKSHKIYKTSSGRGAAFDHNRLADQSQLSTKRGWKGDPSAHNHHP